MCVPVQASILQWQANSSQISGPNSADKMIPTVIMKMECDLEDLTQTRARPHRQRRKLKAPTNTLSCIHCKTPAFDSYIFRTLLQQNETIVNSYVCVFMAPKVPASHSSQWPEKE